MGAPLATVALFNLVSWLMTRRSLYAVFALFLLGNLLRWMALDGTANQFLFPDRPAIIAALVTPLLGGLLVAGALFQMNLLQLQHHHRWLLRFYQVAVALGVLLMLTPLIGHAGLLSSLIFAQMLLVLSVSPLFAPLFGVLLADHFIVRRRRVDPAGLAAEGLNLPGLAAWAIGVGAYQALSRLAPEAGATLPSFAAAAAAYLALRAAVTRLAGPGTVPDAGP
jgi:hypothetical protein